MKCANPLCKNSGKDLPSDAFPVRKIREKLLYRKICFECYKDLRKHSFDKKRITENEYLANWRKNNKQKISVYNAKRYKERIEKNICLKSLIKDNTENKNEKIIDFNCVFCRTKHKLLIIKIISKKSLQVKCLIKNLLFRIEF